MGCLQWLCKTHPRDQPPSLFFSHLPAQKRLPSQTHMPLHIASSPLDRLFSSKNVHSIALSLSHTQDAPRPRAGQAASSTPPQPPHSQPINLQPWPSFWGLCRNTHSFRGKTAGLSSLPSVRQQQIKKYELWISGQPTAWETSALQQRELPRGWGSTSSRWSVGQQIPMTSPFLEFQLCLEPEEREGRGRKDFWGPPTPSFPCRGLSPASGRGGLEFSGVESLGCWLHHNTHAGCQTLRQWVCRECYGKI